MRFAPQRRALFRHHNFQKWSDVVVLCTFWLGNVLRATAACNFSFLIWPAGSAPAALASLLFDPLEPQIIGKRQGFATFLPFRVPISSFLWFFFVSDLFSSTLLFYSSLLADSSHLCFSSVHIDGNLISTLNFLRILKSKERPALSAPTNLVKNAMFWAFSDICVQICKQCIVAFSSNFKTCSHYCRLFINGFMLFRQWILERKFNFVLLRYA